MNKKDLNVKKQVEIEAPKKVKYQCLHTEEARECTCIRIILSNINFILKFNLNKT